MNDTFNIITLIFSAMALIISVISWFSSYQMTLKQMKSSVYSAIIGRLHEINKLEIEKPSLFQALYEDFSIDSLKQAEDGFTHYLFMVFNLYEEAYIQHEKFGLFDNEEMKQWENRLRNDFIQRKFLRGYWKNDQMLFGNERSKKFSTFVDSVLKEVEQLEAN